MPPQSSVCQDGSPRALYVLGKNSTNQAPPLPTEPLLSHLSPTQIASSQDRLVQLHSKANKAWNRLEAWRPQKTRGTAERNIPVHPAPIPRASKLSGLE